MPDFGEFGKFQFTSEQTDLNITSRRFRVGSGMAAQAAESAGADFILALGAGRMRSIQSDKEIKNPAMTHPGAACAAALASSTAK